MTRYRGCNCDKYKPDCRCHPVEEPMTDNTQIAHLQGQINGITETHRTLYAGMQTQLDRLADQLARLKHDALHHQHNLFPGDTNTSKAFTLSATTPPPAPDPDHRECIHHNGAPACRLGMGCRCMVGEPPELEPAPAPDEDARLQSETHQMNAWHEVIAAGNSDGWRTARRKAVALGLAAPAVRAVCEVDIDAMRTKVAQWLMDQFDGDRHLSPSGHTIAVRNHPERGIWFHAADDLLGMIQSSAAYWSAGADTQGEGE